MQSSPLNWQSTTMLENCREQVGKLKYAKKISNLQACLVPHGLPVALVEVHEPVGHVVGAEGAGGLGLGLIMKAASEEHIQSLD